MKKLCIVLIIFLCGCSNKLTCTYTTNYDDIKINNKIIFDLKKHQSIQTDIMIFSTNEEASTYYNDIKDYIEEYNLTLDDNKIISNLTNSLDEDIILDELKEKYISYDYKCK